MELPILNIERPLVFFDIETTGLDILTDRIVEIGIVKLYPGGATEEFLYRFNPQMPIPAFATAVHNITDEMVANEPKLSDIKEGEQTWAQYIYSIFEDADIAGFNSSKFDVPLLANDLKRNGVELNFKAHRQVDVQKIYHKFETRTLIDAYRFYCGKELENAHSALADIRATYEVLRAQVARYEQIENNLDSIIANTYLNDDKPMNIFLTQDKDGDWRFAFGACKGKKVVSCPELAKSMINGDYPQSVKKKIKEIFDK